MSVDKGLNGIPQGSQTQFRDSFFKAYQGIEDWHIPQRRGLPRPRRQNVRSGADGHTSTLTKLYLRI